jgi:hypothetical protein
LDSKADNHLIHHLWECNQGLLETCRSQEPNKTSLALQARLIGQGIKIGAMMAKNPGRYLYECNESLLETCRAQGLGKTSLKLQARLIDLGIKIAELMAKKTGGDRSTKWRPRWPGDYPPSPPPGAVLTEDEKRIHALGHTQRMFLLEAFDKATRLIELEAAEIESEWIAAGRVYRSTDAMLEAYERVIKPLNLKGTSSNCETKPPTGLLSEVN